MDNTALTVAKWDIIYNWAENVSLTHHLLSEFIKFICARDSQSRSFQTD